MHFLHNMHNYTIFTLLFAGALLMFYRMGIMSERLRNKNRIRMQQARARRNI